MEECSNVSALARELGIRRKFLYQWRAQARQAERIATAPAPAFDPETQQLRQRIAELERLAGCQAAELDFFKGALRRVEARRRAARLARAPALPARGKNAEFEKSGDCHLFASRSISVLSIPCKARKGWLSPLFSAAGLLPRAATEP
jgi:transposase-like protein